MIDRFTDLLLNGPPSDRISAGLQKWDFQDVLFGGMMQLNQIRGTQQWTARDVDLSSLSGVELSTSSIDTFSRLGVRDEEFSVTPALQSPLSPLSPQWPP